MNTYSNVATSNSYSSEDLVTEHLGQVVRDALDQA